MSKVKDFMKSVSSSERNKIIEKYIYKFRHVVRWYEKNKKRTDESATLLNCLAAVADYLDVANHSFDKHISILAMATRNIYELKLRIATIIESQEEMEKWKSEAITDGIETYTGFAEHPNCDLDTKAIFGDEITRLEMLRKKYQLPKVKPENSHNLAGKLKLHEDHKAYFKYMSKLVHPSSMLINGKKMCEEHFFHLLELSVQVYSYEAYDMVCSKLLVPIDISKIKYKSH